MRWSASSRPSSVPRSTEAAIASRSRCSAGRAEGPKPTESLRTDEGRLEALHRIAGRLLADSAAASHSLLVDARRSLDEAPPFFDAMAEELRSRYPIETRRNELSAPAVVEGDLTVPGHLVVSVVLGAVGELAPCRADDRAGLPATQAS